MRLAGIATLISRNLRRLRSDGAAPWVVAGVVLVAAFAVAAAPRFYNVVSDEALAEAAGEATPGARNIVVEQGMRIPRGPVGDQLLGVTRRGDELWEEMPPEIASVVSDRAFVVDSPMLVVSKYPGDEGDPPARFIRLRSQQGIGDHTDLVAGAMPETVGSIVVEFDEEDVELRRFEIAITPDTADRMQIGVGSRIIVDPQVEDPLNTSIPSRRLQYRFVLEVSGIVNLIDPDAEFWYGDERLHQPFLGFDPGNPDAIIAYGMGLFADGDYGRLLAETSPSLWSYGWRFFVDPERFDAGDIGGLLNGVLDYELALGAGAFAGINEPRLSTGLAGILDSFLSRRQLTVDVMSLVVAGLAGLALSVVALLGALTANRRRDSIVLARSRGGTALQLAGAQLVEGVVVLLPAGLIGYFTASAIVTGRAAPGLVVAVVGTVIATAGVGVLAALPRLRRRLAEIDGAVSEHPLRRLTVEALLVAVAVGGLVLYRRRGLDTTSLGGGDGGFDPFLAAVPLLLTLAAGVVLLRLYAIVLRRARWVGSAAKGPVGFVGLGRLERQSVSTQLPIPVVVLAIGLAGFAALLLASIDRSRIEATWQAVGADYSIESYQRDRSLSDLVDLSSVRTIEATADVTVLSARLSTSGPTVTRVPVVAIDASEYAEVSAGTPADPQIPEALLEALNFDPELGEPIPALVSSLWPVDPRPGEGDVITMDLGSIEADLIVEGRRDSFPSLELGRPFVVVPRAAVEASLASVDLTPTRRFIRAPASAGPEMAALLAEQSRGTRLNSQEGMLDDLSDAPLVGAVDDGYKATLVLATVFAVLAALAGMALTAQDRARDLGYLRTMGLAPRQVFQVTVLEQVPWVVMSTAAGVLFAIVLTWAVAPGIDLGPFTGSGVPVRVRIAWDWLGLIAAGMLAVVMAATALYSYATRRLNLGTVLRIGDRR